MESNANLTADYKGIGKTVFQGLVVTPQGYGSAQLIRTGGYSYTIVPAPPKEKFAFTGTINPSGNNCGRKASPDSPEAEGIL